MTQLMTIADVLAGIQDGAADDNLDAVTEAVKHRRKQLEARMAAMLRPGDRVVIGGNVRPTYLLGMTGEYLRKDGSRLLVKLDEQHRAQAARFLRTYGPDAGTMKLPLGTVRPL